jgi:hypothetical protein
MPQNIPIAIAESPYSKRKGALVYDIKTGQSLIEESLRRGGLEYVGEATRGATGSVYIGIFSGGMATADPETGELTFPNPPPPVTKANYILYKPGEHCIFMQPKFDWFVNDGEDGPGFTYNAYPLS